MLNQLDRKPLENQMEECMKDSMRKLALWYTRTFKPLMSHDELDSIMATLGFVSSAPSNVGGILWKEYSYSDGRCWSKSKVDPLPKPRLPHPRIDGLHIYTYRAFIDAINFYLEMDVISDLFHVRGMPLHRSQDRSRKWRRMEDDDSIFVYWDGTLDQTTNNLYRPNKDGKNGAAGACFHEDPTVIRKSSNKAPFARFVSIDDTVS